MDNTSERTTFLGYCLRRNRVDVLQAIHAARIVEGHEMATLRAAGCMPWAQYPEDEADMRSRAGSDGLRRNPLVAAALSGNGYAVTQMIELGALVELASRGGDDFMDIVRHHQDGPEEAGELEAAVAEALLRQRLAGATPAPASMASRPRVRLAL